MGYYEKKFLFIQSAVFTVCAFVVLAVALVTDSWLYTLEKIGEDVMNKTETFRNSYQGIWRVCSYKASVTSNFPVEKRWKHVLSLDIPYHCQLISYGKPDDDFDPSDILEMIQKNVRKATAFPFLSLAVLTFGSVVTTVGHCKNTGKKPLNFFSGIVFVSAGLLNLVGLVVYIASVTEEVGHKSQAPRDDPVLKYSYGWSVFLSAIAFTLMEFAGAMFVYVYIKRYKKSFAKKHERMKNVTTTMQYSANPDDIVDGVRYADFPPSPRPAPSNTNSPPLTTTASTTARMPRSNATSVTGVSDLFSSRPDVDIESGGDVEVGVGALRPSEPEDFVARPSLSASSSAHRSRSVSRTNHRDFGTGPASRDASPYDMSSHAHLRAPFISGAALPTAYHNVGFGEPRVSTATAVGYNANKQYQDRSRDSSNARLGLGETLRRTTAI